MQKVPCQKCGALILPVTAARNEGLCVPCKAGTRESMERSKAYYKEQSELDRTDPERLYWKALVSRVHGEGGSFNSLSRPEQKYFASHCLLGEVYNGGFDQFFYNSAGAHYLTASESLLEIGAKSSLRALREAKEILFPGRDVPENTAVRRNFLSNNRPLNPTRLDELDKEFWDDPDSLHEKLSKYAVENGLF